METWHIETAEEFGATVREARRKEGLWQKEFELANILFVRAKVGAC